jgi:hypothetical protein
MGPPSLTLLVAVLAASSCRFAIAFGQDNHSGAFEFHRSEGCAALSPAKPTSPPSQPAAFAASLPATTTPAQMP